jgi:uncharacterized protein
MIVMSLILATLIGVAPASATGVYDFSATPQAGEWVVDQADILSRLTEGQLNSTLNKLASETGNEVHMVTIHRLDYGETVDSFANQLFETWFPSPDAQAQQALVVLDNVTNTIAIRTGEAVKAVLPDETAKSVTQETMMVPLRDGNKYNQSFLDASDRLLAILSGKPDPGPPAIVATVDTKGTFATPEQTKGSNATLWVIGLLVAATVIPMATYYLYLAFQSQ